MYNVCFSLKVWIENSFLFFHSSLSPSAWTTDVMMVATVVQVNKGHTRGWKGHQSQAHPLSPSTSSSPWTPIPSRPARWPAAL